MNIYLSLDHVPRRILLFLLFIGLVVVEAELPPLDLAQPALPLLHLVQHLGLLLLLDVLARLLLELLEDQLPLGFVLDKFEFSEPRVERGGLDQEFVVEIFGRPLLEIFQNALLHI